MPDNNALHGQDGQEVTEELKAYQISALNLLDIPLQLFRVVAGKMQAEGITIDIPTEPGELIEGYLSGALDDPLIRAAGDCSARSEKLDLEMKLLKKPEQDPDGEWQLQALRKSCERETFENLAMLGYRSIALKFIVSQNIDTISAATTEEEGEALLRAFIEKLTPALVADHSLTTELADELTGEEYWNIDSADLLEATTEEGTMWAQAVAGAVKRREDPGSVPVSLRRIISAFDEVREGIAEDLAQTSIDPEVAQALQAQRIPDEVSFPIDKATRALLFDRTAKTGWEWTPINMGGKNLQAYIAISLEELPQGVAISRDLTAHDNAVFRAICSLRDNGAEIFTADDIYKVMTGNTKATPSPEQREAIHESWIRLTTTIMAFDTGNVGTAYKFERWKETSHVIEGTTGEHIVGNQWGTTITRYYKVSAQPILVRFANHMNQIARYPLHLSNTPVNKTPDNIAIQNALLDRIFAIPHLSRTILYSDIFTKSLDGKMPTGVKKQRLREYIAKMLDYWVNAGLLESWEEIKKGRSAIGVKVKEVPRRKGIANKA